LTAMGLQAPPLAPVTRITAPRAGWTLVSLIICIIRGARHRNIATEPGPMPASTAVTIQMTMGMSQGILRTE